MRAIIVDDERLARVELRRLLSSHPEVEIVAEARGPEEALAAVSGAAPDAAIDVMFLDIQMPGMSGFDLLERLDEVPQVIFTTAYDEFAIQAFQVNALDYLMKPISAERLAAALSRVRPQRAADSDHGARPRHLRQIFVRDGAKCWLVRMEDVFLLESEGNYTRLCFENARPLIRRSLDSLEQQLDASVFFRANRRQIINLQRVDRMDQGVGGGLLASMRDGPSVEISRRQSARLRETLSL